VKVHQVLFSFFLHYCHCDSTIKQIGKEQNFYTFKSIGNEELVREHALSFFVGNVVWKFEFGNFGQVVGVLQW
jgi:hypothetical protein